MQLAQAGGLASETELPNATMKARPATLMPATALGLGSELAPAQAPVSVSTRVWAAESARAQPKARASRPVSVTAQPAARGSAAESALAQPEARASRPVAVTAPRRARGSAAATAVARGVAVELAHSQAGRVTDRRRAALPRGPEVQPREWTGAAAAPQGGVAAFPARPPPPAAGPPGCPRARQGPADPAGCASTPWGAAR